MNDAQNVFYAAKRYRSSIERYLLSQSCEKYSNRRIQRTTNIEKGEFEFLIHRLNLSTKRNRTDFEKYLNESDVTQLEQLLTALIKNDVFRLEYLRKLNNFFTRENLRDIIALGKKILALKSTNLKTIKARAAIGEVTDDKRTIRQMESLWQKYFEENLLF